MACSARGCTRNAVVQEHHSFVVCVLGSFEFILLSDMFFHREMSIQTFLCLYLIMWQGQPSAALPSAHFRTPASTV